MATKQCHEDFGKRQESLLIGFEGGFTAQRVANEHDGKIDEIVVTKARSGESYLFLKCFQDPLMSEYLSYRSHFSHPGRGCGNGCGSNLDGYRRMRHDSRVCPPYLERDQLTSS